jgi:phenylalanine-4-hydroxylase
MEDNIPEVDYNNDENYTWTYMWDNLKPLYKQYACKEYNDNFELLHQAGVLTREKVPQLSKISKFLKEKTGFIYRPVAGMLSQREFLNGLAYKVFHSTQYIRHRQDPLYTPEPDIIHEVMGHSIMFADEDFADFTQAIGIASLGASDEDLKRLGNIYWFTIEFGITREKGERKLFGAGILGSPTEIKWAASNKPNFYEFDFDKIAEFSFSTTELQTNYFIVPSVPYMKEKVLEYIESMKRPFNVTYDPVNRAINVDRNIITRRESNEHKVNELLF